MVRLTGILLLLSSFFPILALAQELDSLRGIDSLTFTAPIEEDLIDQLIINTEAEPVVEQIQLYLDDSIESFSNRVSPSRVSVRSRVVVNPEALDDPNYDNGTYRGSSIKTSNMLSAKTTDFEFYLIQSKDAGEPIFFDRIGAALSLRKSQRLSGDLKLSRLALADYSLNVGSGLILSRGYPNYPSKQSVRNNMISGEEIKPYHSTSSYRSFRGAASELQYRSLSLTMFFSDRLIDAAIDSNEITSLPASGYHRTAAELDKRNTARQTLNGGILSFENFDTSHNGFSAGIAAYRLKFDKPEIGRAHV